jgi:anti-sigma regulatory factor (Ser/Thr protein kinase)
MSFPPPESAVARVFRHEALLYAGEQEFAERVGDFVRAGLEAGERVMVAVSAAKSDILREALGRHHADAVDFADMESLGANPARIIPAWRELVDSGRPVRGIGEPITVERGGAALVECQRHEVLLNLAFGAGPGWMLMCPYDVGALEPAVIEECERSHPYVCEHGQTRASVAYGGLAAAEAPFADALPEPAAVIVELEFGRDDLASVRRATEQIAAAAGLDRSRVGDLMLAANEIATNSVLHGGGRGMLRLWGDRGALMCEVRDAGFIDEPLAGRRRPPAASIGGNGLWVVNQLCDLVQVRSSPSGTIVRMHMGLV